MKWEDAGLNIFLSTKVSLLPPDLFSFTPEQKNKTLCLVGHGGRALWEKLPHPLDVHQHPLDQYTIKKMQAFAHEVLDDDIEILFPNEHYQLPLQRIGRFLNLCSQSPIGLDISEEFGLWFAFRGIFLTRKEVLTPKISSAPALCMSCSTRPCLQTPDIDLARTYCPVKTEHQYSFEQRQFHQSALSILKA